MRSMQILLAFATIAFGVVATCGHAARRVMFLLSAFVGVPLGMTADWNDLGGGTLLWMISGATAAACMAVTDAIDPARHARDDGRH